MRLDRGVSSPSSCEELIDNDINSHVVNTVEASLDHNTQHTCGDAVAVARALTLSRDGLRVTFVCACLEPHLFVGLDSSGNTA